MLRGNYARNCTPLSPITYHHHRHRHHHYYYLPRFISLYLSLLHLLPRFLGVSVVIWQENLESWLPISCSI